MWPALLSKRSALPAFLLMYACVFVFCAFSLVFAINHTHISCLSSFIDAISNYTTWNFMKIKFYLRAVED